MDSSLWEREELLCILKYEPSKRNKAAFALFWDLNARNHERYGEGEIPHEAKSGTGVFEI
jgi:integrase/recombinase XerD